MNARQSFTGPAILVLNISDAFSEEGVIDISGTFTGLAATVDGSVDGTNFRALALSPLAGGADVASLSAVGGWRFNLGGLQVARVNVTAVTTGTAVVAAATTRKAA